jgi:hypothetical protein
MATVKDVILFVGRGLDGKDIAQVSYKILFSPIEVRLNIPFHERVLVYEQDDALDAYVESFGYDNNAVPPPRPAPEQIVRGDRDDWIGELFNQENSVEPNGQPVVDRVHAKQWRFPSNESGNEEYKALVVVTPSICRSSAWSNTVSINLR